MKKGLIISGLMAFILLGTQTYAYHFLSDGMITENMELTFGFFAADGDFISDSEIYFIRWDNQLNERFSVCAEFNYWSIDVLGIDLSTYGLGVGGTYMLMEDTPKFPLNFSLKGSVDHFFKREKEEGIFIVTVGDFTDIELTAVFSKVFKFGTAGMTVIPYAHAGLIYEITSDENDTSNAFAIGGRLRFNNNWSLYAEMDLGDVEGFAFGGAYSF